MKISLRKFLKYCLILILIGSLTLTVLSLWFLNYTIKGVMLKNGIKENNIIFSIERNQWRIFLFEQRTNNTRYVGFLSIVKQGNRRYNATKILLPVISEKTIVCANYSDIKKWPSGNSHSSRRSCQNK